MPQLFRQILRALKSTANICLQVTYAINTGAWLCLSLSRALHVGFDRSDVEVHHQIFPKHHGSYHPWHGQSPFGH